MKTGDLVITRFRNRWGIECAGTIEAIRGDTADVRVWNAHGPGADMLATGVPIAELTPDTAPAIDKAEDE